MRAGSPILPARKPADERPPKKTTIANDPRRNVSFPAATVTERAPHPKTHSHSAGPEQSLGYITITAVAGTDVTVEFDVSPLCPVSVRRVAYLDGVVVGVADDVDNCPLDANVIPAADTPRGVVFIAGALFDTDQDGIARTLPPGAYVTFDAPTDVTFETSPSVFQTFTADATGMHVLDVLAQLVKFRTDVTAQSVDAFTIVDEAIGMFGHASRGLGAASFAGSTGGYLTINDPSLGAPVITTGATVRFGTEVLSDLNFFRTALQGADLNGFTIIDESTIGTFVTGGLPATTLGGAVVDQTAAGLVISNIGSSGLDGVRFDVGQSQGFAVSIIDWTPILDAFIDLAVSGSINGTPDSAIGTMQLALDAVSQTTTADFSPLGVTEYTVRLVNVDDVVATFIAVETPVITVPAEEVRPTELRYEYDQIDRLISVSDYSVTPRTVTVMDGAAALGTHPATSVQIEAVVPPAAGVVFMQTASLLLTNVDSLTIPAVGLVMDGMSNLTLGGASIAGGLQGAEIVVTGVDIEAATDLGSTTFTIEVYNAGAFVDGAGGLSGTLAQLPAWPNHGTAGNVFAGLPGA